jgi:hypothetical protein
MGPVRSFVSIHIIRVYWTTPTSKLTDDGASTLTLCMYMHKFDSDWEYLEPREKRAMSRPDKFFTRIIFWRACCGAGVVLAILTFTPIVLDGASKRIFEVPYTLLMGIFIALGFIVLTIIGSQCYPKHQDGGDDC